MSLSVALNNAISGLRVNQQSLNVLSQNIANVNTEGYSRETLAQSAVVLAGQGNGVQIDDVLRKIDKYIQRSVQSQGSVNNTAQTISEYYQRVQGYLGQPGASNSLDTYMTTFLNALQTVANTPETVSYHSNAVQAGKQLADQISGLAQSIEDLRFQADQDILDGVKTINESIDKLEKLNISISIASSLGQSTAGLLDDRDLTLQKISEIMDISVNYDVSGSINVVSGNGVALVERGVSHRLQYTPVQSADALINGAALGAVNMITTVSSGATSVNSIPLITAGKSGDVTSGVTTGTMAAFQMLRDEILPEILNQLDMMASRVRDATNAVHNQGTGFPPASTLLGERPLSAYDTYEWSGQVRIAALNADGTPVAAAYADESTTGIRPLNLDLSQLDSGSGPGNFTVQAVIDEINNHFGPPGNKAEVGNLNNIQLVADSSQLPSGAPNYFNFDFDTDNISRNNAGFFVTGVTVLDDAATNITSLTTPAPSFTLDTTSTYTTTLGSGDVAISATSLSGVSVGDTIYMNGPGVALVDGIPAANLTGYFVVKAVVGNQFTITASGGATATLGTIVPDAAPGTMMAAYGNPDAGQQIRTKPNGAMKVDLSANSASTFYDITVNVGVVDKTTGVVTTSQITYRVNNPARDLMNNRYDATVVGAGGTLVSPLTSQAALRAIMVDANGNELPKFNGKYADTPGYLKLIGGLSGSATSPTNLSVGIDEMDSKQLGRPNGSPSEAGTNRGFSHYFGLNNFFKANDASATGDALKNSAVHLAVDQRIIDNPNLISTGRLVLQKQPSDTALPAQYTYVRYSGDNAIALKLSALSNLTVQFDQAGGLPNTQVTLQAYISNFLGYTSSQTNATKDTASNAKAIYDGFKTRQQSVAGVNLDEELANTITFQNAYSATAKVVSTVKEMYDTLMQVV